MARNQRDDRPLRSRAEERLSRSKSFDAERLGAEEVRHIVHELQVHQCELEIQNEELRRTQVALEESRERYRGLFEDSPVGYAMLDSEGTVLAANRRLASLLAVPISELTGQKLSRFIIPTSQDAWYLQRRALKQEHEPRTFELQLQRPGGEVFHAQIVASSDLPPGEKELQLRLAIVDVTELRAAERALRRAASQASLAEQEERRRLALDLHDDVGQTLSLASLILRRLSQARGAEQEQGYRELDRLLAEARERISSLSFRLSPPILYDVGLVAAAEWLAEYLEQRYGLVVTIARAGEPEMDAATRVTLYRALRELLVNVAKHSGAHEARVRVWQEGTSACLEVTDGGKGFDPAQAHQGFGLLALRERVGHLGGTVTISSADGSGARILICVPRLTGAKQGEEGPSQ